MDREIAHVGGGDDGRSVLTLCHHSYLAKEVPRAERRGLEQLSGSVFLLQAKQYAALARRDDEDPPRLLALLDDHLRTFITGSLYVLIHYRFITGSLYVLIHYTFITRSLQVN